jgi:rubrerythrin
MANALLVSRPRRASNQAMAVQRHSLRAQQASQAYLTILNRDHQMDDILQQQWACLTCSAKFSVGEVIIPAGHLACDPWPCPRCGKPTLAVADGATRTTDVYYGEIGTKN